MNCLEFSLNGDQERILEIKVLNEGDLSKFRVCIIKNKDELTFAKKDNIYEFDNCPYIQDESLIFENSLKFYQKDWIQDYNEGDILNICFLNRNEEISDISANVLVREGENICPFDCISIEDNGNCNSGTCECSSGYFGKGCSQKIYQLKDEEPISLELDSEFYYFFYIDSQKGKNFISNF